MDAVEVPPYFLCPISLDIMKDPVTVSTGITYDRESIEKWIFSQKMDCCPVTKQVLIDSDLTPNHTLRRLIQSWCTLNASSGIERFPTPRPQISKSQVTKLLNDAKSPERQIKCLERLKSIASENVTNKRCLESSGAAEFLASIVTNAVTELASVNSLSDCVKAGDEALCILYNLQLSESGLKSLFGETGEFIDSLTLIMRTGGYESRAYAAMLLKSMFKVAEPLQMTRLKPEVFGELVQILNDQISQKATKSTLHSLITICPWSRNRVKAVESGAVSALIDLLLDSSTDQKKRCIEMAIVLLEQLCQCAEGRAELLKHGAGLAVVSKKILRVSKVASERAVRILYSISKFSATPVVLQEMLNLGVVAKLCLVLQVDCSSKTNERVKEILKLHARVWKNTTCIPNNLLSLYPS